MFDSITGMAKKIVSVLNGNVHSFWLYGSVVQDDFRLGWSDIDMLVLTGKQFTDSQAQELVQLRQIMAADAPGNPYYPLFEGVIANLDEYLSGTFSRLVYWGTTGQRITDRYKPDPFSQYELAMNGKSVYGSDDRRIFTVPDRETLIEAVRSHYETIRKYAQQTDGRLYSCGWLLDICRCIHTLRNNDVISKTQAGIWALQEHIFPYEDPLKKTIEIRKEPTAYKNQEDIQQWLKGLGPVVQQYADVLECELSGTAVIKETAKNVKT